MEDEIARRRESIPPPSVSRVMQRMGIPGDRSPITAGHSAKKRCRGHLEGPLGPRRQPQVADKRTLKGHIEGPLPRARGRPQRSNEPRRRTGTPQVGRAPRQELTSRPPSHGGEPDRCSLCEAPVAGEVRVKSPTGPVDGAAGGTPEVSVGARATARRGSKMASALRTKPISCAHARAIYAEHDGSVALRRTPAANRRWPLVLGALVVTRRCRRRDRVCGDAPTTTSRAATAQSAARPPHPRRRRCAAEPDHRARPRTHPRSRAADAGAMRRGEARVREDARSRRRRRSPRRQRSRAKTTKSARRSRPAQRRCVVAPPGWRLVRPSRRPPPTTTPDDDGHRPRRTRANRRQRRGPRRSVRRRRTTHRPTDSARPTRRPSSSPTSASSSSRAGDTAGAAASFKKALELDAEEHRRR